MSLSNTLYTLLNPLAVGGASVDAIPDTPTFPLTVFQQVGGRAFEYLDQSLPSHDHARVQVWAWARDPDQADALIRSVRVALLGSELVVETLGAEVSDYNEALKLYGRRQDFGIWHQP